MYKRILVPLDGSKVAEGILSHVHQLAKATGGEILLLRVLQPVPLEGGYPRPIEMRTKSAYKYLARLQDTLASQGVSATVAVTAGVQAGDAISTWAGEHEVDLIALMSHGFGRAARAVFGSVAERLLERSPVPVLVVRATPEVLEQQEEQEEDELDEELLFRMGALG